MEKKPTAIVKQSGATIKGQVIPRGLNPETATIEQIDIALIYLASQILERTDGIALVETGEGDFGCDEDAPPAAHQFMDKFLDVAAAIYDKHSSVTYLSSLAQAANAMAADIDAQRPTLKGQPQRLDTLSTFQRAIENTSRMQ